jgi:predicted nucleotidyltransferase component of viral defense system
MRLHQNENLFLEAVRATAQKMNILPIYVEKDYWVTYALFTIFNNEIGNDTVFKGGTALSKCYNIIERFSEDIDLVVLRGDGESDSKLKSKLKSISKVVESVLSEVKIPGLSYKIGKHHKTAYAFNKHYKNEDYQVRDVIIVESTWMGSHEPYTIKRLCSFIGQIMIANKQEGLAKEYQLLPFELKVLDPTRTICEKIMSLVRFSHAERPLDDLTKKIRHTYDLHQLLKQEVFLKFFLSIDFDQMLLKVAIDDVSSFRNNNAFLKYHPSEAIIFRDLEKVWEVLKNVYNEEFSNLVYGKLPNEKEVFTTLILIRERLKLILWDLEIS